LNQLNKIDDKIKKNIQNKILYFPTYRRVEEDLTNLGYKTEEIRSDEILIQFGMKDVKERLVELHQISKFINRMVSKINVRC